MKKPLFYFIVLCVLCTSIFVSCSKDSNDNNNGGGNNNTENAKVDFRLTDGPADYDAIYLDVRSVEVTMEGRSPVVLTPISPGIYNILRFRNGLDTLLLRADLPPGKIGQIRLILGNDNSIVVNGVSHPLNTPSAQESGLKLNLQQTFVAGGSYVIWIDFDAAKSINQTGNGTYKLKPVIRAYASETNGRIKGNIAPLGVLSTVYVIQGADTFAAIPDPIDGFFRVSGLPSGTYQVWIDVDDNSVIEDVTLPNVQVTYGVETDLGVIDVSVL